MSRKHFIAIAASIKQQGDAIWAAGYSETDQAASLGTLRATAHNLAGVFANSNPLFNRARFLTACGM